MIVVAAVAFLAVAQQQLRGGGGGESFPVPFYRFQHDEGGGLGADETDFEDGMVDKDDHGANEWVEGTGRNDDQFFGLVGLSLTYALPIVGGLRPLFALMCGYRLLNRCTRHLS